MTKRINKAAAKRLKKRIEEVFTRRVEAGVATPSRNREPPYGAQAWFADQSGSDPVTVYRWCNAKLPIPTWVHRLLDSLENTEAATT